MADAYLNNAQWVHRIEELFAQADLNKNGFLELADWELWVNNTEKACNPSPAVSSKLRQAMRDFCAGLGLTEGKKSTREQFVKDFAAFAVVERRKKERGEEPLLLKLNVIWYDVVDTNHDGSLTLDEYRTVMSACNFDPSAADATFKILDKNKNGKVEIKELNEHEFKFWFALEDPGSKGLFGDIFEKK